MVARRRVRVAGTEDGDPIGARKDLLNREIDLDTHIQLIEVLPARYPQRRASQSKRQLPHDGSQSTS
jgi:hypothetical protein